MIRRAVHPLDALLVASAGDPLRRGEATDADLELAGAMAEVERELREREWAALGRVLAVVEGEAVIFPDSESDAVAVAVALYAIGWHKPGPPEDDAG
jgi:hypothetical protein